MEMVRIRIGELGAPPLFPDVSVHPEDQVVLRAVGILEAATQQGRTGVALLVTDRAGRTLLVELPAARFLTIAGAVKGAMARFGEPWDGA